MRQKTRNESMKERYEEAQPASEKLICEAMKMKKTCFPNFFC